jgi:hypothetical protein
MNLSSEVRRSNNHSAASNIATDVTRQFVIKSSFEIMTSVRRRQMWLNYLSLNEVRRNNKRTAVTNIKNKCYSTICHKIVVSLLDGFCSSSFVNGNSSATIGRARGNKSLTHNGQTKNFVKFKDISVCKL